MTSIDVAMVDKLLTTTRAVRYRMDFDKPVDPVIIEECIDVALQAPVGSPGRTAHFVLINDPDTRARVSAVYKKAIDAFCQREEPAELQTHDAAKHDRIKRMFTTYRWYAKNLHRVPVLVLVVMPGRFDHQNPAVYADHYGCVLPAAWSLMLALRARGLGACWTTEHIRYEEETARLLGIPDDFTQAVLLPVGYYKGSQFHRAARPRASRRIHVNGWANREF